MIDTGASVGDLIVLEPEELGRPAFWCECIGASGKWHRALYTKAALEAGRARCSECVKLNEQHEARRQARAKEVQAERAGHPHVIEFEP